MWFLAVDLLEQVSPGLVIPLTTVGEHVRDGRDVNGLILVSQSSADVTHFEDHVVWQFALNREVKLIRYARLKVGIRVLRQPPAPRSTAHAREKGGWARFVEGAGPSVAPLPSVPIRETSPWRGATATTIAGCSVLRSLASGGLK